MRCKGSTNFANVQEKSHFGAIFLVKGERRKEKGRDLLGELTPSTGQVAEIQGDILTTTKTTCFNNNCAQNNTLGAQGYGVTTELHRTTRNCMEMRGCARILFVRNGRKEKSIKRKKHKKKEVRAKRDKDQRICANRAIDMYGKRGNFVAHSG